ncbi:hypothetical protein PROFUN_15258 [Planoprotostelium fungivorum]|uniref:Uncharacterized protein n=1 Tax=Planoprotostelium fungivorum TaxID=1890364 RepID=A0A2P6MXH4_9EUKA|nr:hypothetical protein PROFUN_15258 [Planoprotostelium fungivorum]
MYGRERGFQLIHSVGRGQSNHRRHEGQVCDSLIPLLATEQTIFSRDIAGNIITDDRGCIFCYKTSPRGTSVAMSMGDVIQVLDGKTKKPRHLLRGHQEIVTSIAWLLPKENAEQPAEDTFFSSSLDKTIKLWKGDTCIATLRDHQDWIRCLSVNEGNDTLVSGCVSSMIVGWDVETLRPKFKLAGAHKSEVYPMLNTINSMSFMPGTSNVVVSGTKDGTIKLWDIRGKPVEMLRVRCHKNRLNSAVFNSGGDNILTSGRDHAVRLWDVRKLNETKGEEVGEALREFTQHKCEGYNINSSFYNQDRHIVTGSEDHQVYIYDIASGSLVNRLKGHRSIVHIVDTCDHHPLSISSSSIDKPTVLLWSPSLSHQVEETKWKVECTVEDTYRERQISIVENLIRRHGDEVFRVFHKYNFTFSMPSDWNAFLTNIQTIGGDSSVDVLRMVAEVTSDFSRSMEELSEEELAEMDESSEMEQTD